MKTRKTRADRRFTRLLIATMILSVLALITMVVAFSSDSFHFRNHKPTNEMPDLIGLTEKEAIDAIKAAILADGYGDPIGVWGEKNVIVEGHGRVMACKQLDHLTDEQRKEYAIRHNRSAEFSTWDFKLLAEEIEKLEAEGMDL